MERSKILSRTAAAVVAASIYEAFPGSELLGGGETSTGFFYQFFYSIPLPPEAIRMLEERMRQVIREDRPIREMEMVACSAKELFAKADHKAAVDALEDFEPKELVSVVKVGSFCDLMDGPFRGSSRDVGAFQLLKLQSLGDQEYRVEGCAFESKDQLKIFARKYSRYAEENHLFLGTQLGLWERVGERLLWKYRGLFMKRAVIALLRGDSLSEEAAFSERTVLEKIAALKISSGAPYSVWTCEEKARDPEGDEGLFEEHCQSLFQEIFYCTEKDLLRVAISLLQTIGKTLIILGFHAELCLAGRRQGGKGLKLLEKALLASGLKVPFEVDEEAASKIQWIVRDGLGRPHVALELRLESIAEEKKTEEKKVNLLCVKAGVERILSLLLELNVGSLPSRLIPEHIRVLVLGDQNSAYGSEVCASLEKNGYRAFADRRSAPLKEKLFDAMKEKVPFVAIVGDRELQANTVALRDVNSDRTEALTQEQLIERMNRTFKLEN